MLPPSKFKAVPYAWPSNAPFHCDTTALVVIDMQVDCKQKAAPNITPPLSPNRQLIVCSMLLREQR